VTLELELELELELDRPQLMVVCVYARSALECNCACWKRLLGEGAGCRRSDAGSSTMLHPNKQAALDGSGNLQQIILQLWIVQCLPSAGAIIIQVKEASWAER
jgi:hypothetical protein